MPDTPTPTPTPASREPVEPAPAPDAKKTARAQAPINQAFTEELNLAETLAASAAQDGYAARFADEEIDADFLANLTKQIELADGLIALATGKTAEKSGATGAETTTEAALLAQIAKVQARAKRKYKKVRDPMRAKYFIGARLDSNRPLLERSSKAILAVLNGDPAQNLAPDQLPGQKPANTQAFADALDAYVQSQDAQTGSQTDASTARVKLEQQVKLVAGLRRELQYAADVLWPHTDKANAPTRKRFALPPDRALR